MFNSVRGSQRIMIFHHPPDFTAKSFLISVLDSIIAHKGEIVHKAGSRIKEKCNEKKKNE